MEKKVMTRRGVMSADEAAEYWAQVLSGLPADDPAAAAPTGRPTTPGATRAGSGVDVELARRRSLILRLLAHAGLPARAMESGVRRFLREGMAHFPSGRLGRILGREADAQAAYEGMRASIAQGQVEGWVWTSPYLSWAVTPNQAEALRGLLPWLGQLEEAAPKRVANVLATLAGARTILLGSRTPESVQLPKVELEDGTVLDLREIALLVRVKFEPFDPSKGLEGERIVLSRTLARRVRTVVPGSAETTVADREADPFIRDLAQQVVGPSGQVLEVAVDRPEIEEAVVRTGDKAVVSFILKATVDVRPDNDPLFASSRRGERVDVVVAEKPEKLELARLLEAQLRELNPNLPHLPEDEFWGLICFMPETGTAYPEWSSVGLQGLVVLASDQPGLARRLLAEREEFRDLVRDLTSIEVWRDGRGSQAKIEVGPALRRMDPRTGLYMDARFSDLVPAKPDWAGAAPEPGRNLKLWCGMRIPGRFLNARETSVFALVRNTETGVEEWQILRWWRLSPLAYVLRLIATDRNPRTSKVREWILAGRSSGGGEWTRLRDVLETAIGDVLKAIQRPAVFAPELGELADYPAPAGLEDLKNEVLKRAEGPVPVVQAPVSEEGPALLFRYPTFRMLVAWAVPGPKAAIRVGASWAMKALGGDFDGDTLGVIPIRPEDAAFIRRQKASINEVHEAAKASSGRTDEVQFVGRMYQAYLIGLATSSWFGQWLAAGNDEALAAAVAGADVEIKALFDAKHLGASIENVIAAQRRYARLLKKQQDVASWGGIFDVLYGRYGRDGHSLPEGKVLLRAAKELWAIGHGLPAQTRDLPPLPGDEEAPTPGGNDGGATPQAEPASQPEEKVVEAKPQAPAPKPVVPTGAAPVRPNRYPGSCHVCGTRVEAGAGVLVGSAGAWRLYCRRCWQGQGPEGGNTSGGSTPPEPPAAGSGGTGGAAPSSGSAPEPEKESVGVPGQDRVEIWTDASIHPAHPGKALLAVAAYRGEEEILRESRVVEGLTGINQAEYRAVMAGLRFALARGWRRPVLWTDSEIVFRQIRGEYRVKDPKLQVLHSKTMELMRVSGAELRKTTHAGNRAHPSWDDIEPASPTSSSSTEESKVPEVGGITEWDPRIAAGITTDGEFGCLSTSSPHPVRVVFLVNEEMDVLEGRTAGLVWLASRFGPEDEAIRQRVLNASTFEEAILIAWSHCERWQGFDPVHLMFRVLSSKALKHGVVRETLRRTGKRVIVDTTWSDTFWGAVPTPDGKLVGRNMLGILWMRIRKGLNLEE